MFYRKEIDGLRAIAVLAVIFFHSDFNLFSGGFVGVDIFFVISGYLITTIALAEIRNDTFSLLKFYERRVRRILPALFFMMLLTIPFAWFWMLPQDLMSFSQSLITVPLFVSNFLFWLTSGYFDSASELKPLLHTWSLALEEQYYILFPILLIITKKLGKKWIISFLIISAALSVMAAQMTSKTHNSLAFYLLPTRVFEILTGSLISLLLFNKKNPFSFNQMVSQCCSLIGLVLILYSIFSFDNETQIPSLFTLIPTFGASLILIFSNPKNLVGKLLGSKFFVGIGLISYSTYLWNQPLLAFARLRSINEPSLFLIGFLSLLSLAFGYLSWKYIETPFRNNEFINRKKLFVYSVIFSLLFISIGSYGYLSNGIPSRLQPYPESIFFALNDKNPRKEECFNSAEKIPKPQDSCVLGNKNNIKGVLLGDSHANAISFALEKALESKNLGFLSLTYNGCPPVQNVYRVNAPENDKCFEYNEQNFKFLTENKYIHYVLLTARWTMYLEKTRYNNTEGGVEYGDETYIDNVVHGEKKINEDTARVQIIRKLYRTTVENLLQAGKTVIIVYPVPEVGWDVPRTQLKKILFYGDNNPITTSFSAFTIRNEATISTFNSIPDHKNLIRIRPDTIFCNTFVEARCITQIKSKLLYYDDDHLTNEGAFYLINEIMKSIK